MRILPKKLQKALSSALKVKEGQGQQNSVIVAESFLRLFIETLGHYTEFFSHQQDGEQVRRYSPGEEPSPDT